LLILFLNFTYFAATTKTFNDTMECTEYRSESVRFCVRLVMSADSKLSSLVQSVSRHSAMALQLQCIRQSFTLLIRSHTSSFIHLFSHSLIVSASKSHLFNVILTTLAGISFRLTAKYVRQKEVAPDVLPISLNGSNFNNKMFT